MAIKIKLNLPLYRHTDESRVYKRHVKEPPQVPGEITHKKKDHENISISL